MTLLGLILVPLLVGAIAFYVFKATITKKEFVVQAVATVLVMLGGWQLAKYGALQSTEHLNGRIIQKLSGTQSCCHCEDVCDSKDKDGNCTSSHEECDHNHDYWWSLDTTVGKINVRDCSGDDNAPSIWVRARVGEPAAKNHLYTNYLKADSHNVLVHENLGKYASRIPDYPEVYDLYKVNPVLTDGVPTPRDWVEAIREINASLGASRQIDVTVLLTRVQDPTYAQAVESKWLYGPKNSLTVIIGTDGEKATWVRGMTFSKVSTLKVRLRDDIQGLPLNGTVIPDTIKELVRKHFRRTAMANYEYLARTMEPSTGWLVGLYFLAFALSIGLSALMHKKDLFGDEGFRGNPFKRARSPLDVPSGLGPNLFRHSGFGGFGSSFKGRRLF